MSYTCIGIIPARGGSKGVPRKNVRLVAGRPLIAYTIEAALASQLLTEFVTSTEDAEIAAVAEELGSPVLPRPPELAADDTPALAVAQHVLQVMEAQGRCFDYLVWLQPTAPLRTAADIDAALELLWESGADSVVSLAPVPGHYNPHWQFVVEEGSVRLFTGEALSEIIPLRQQLSVTYTRNGAIYACRCSLINSHHTFLGPDTRAYIMPRERSVNIDDELDLLVAEAVLRQR